MGVQDPDAVQRAAEWLRKHFDPELARGFSARFRLELSGPGGGVLGMRIEDGILTLEPGGRSAPDVTIALAAQDFLDVLAGRANGELLFMAGRVRIDGTPSLVLRLQTLFRRRV